MDQPPTGDGGVVPDEGSLGPDQSALMGTGIAALVVDDGIVERLLGKAMLEKLGFTVATAPSGDEAWQMLVLEPVPIVLCDIAMPVMDGLTLLKKTRALPNPPAFIMSTNHEDDRYSQAAMLGGARIYLNKPLRFKVLRMALRTVLATLEPPSPPSPPP